MNFKNSARKWLIPSVPICHLYPDFPFYRYILKKRGKIWAFMLQVDNSRSTRTLSLPRFSIFFNKNRVKSKNSSSKLKRSQVAISNLQPDFPFFSMNSRETGLILRIHRQVANTLNSHTPSLPWFPIWSVNSRKTGVNSENSCYEWIIPEVLICYLYPEFPFFFSVNLAKNGVKSENSSFKWKRSQVTTSNL